MEYLEDYKNLPEIKAELVEETPSKKRKRGYDPSVDFRLYVGKLVSFYQNKKAYDVNLSNWLLMQDTSFVSKPYLEKEKVRMMTSITLKECEKALGYVTAPVTSNNQGNLTRFINRHKRRPKKGLCLLIAFDKPSNRLGMISPIIESIERSRIE